MNMNKIIKKPSYKTLPILAIICCLILASVLFIPNQNVYAEYNDLNENTLVNFNQYIQDTYINYTTDSYFGNDLPVGKYYIRINSNVNTSILFVYSGGAYYGKSITIGQNDFIIDFSNKINAIQFNNSITYKNLNAINLTQMFGAGNEPNLDQCKEYFTAEYYSYNKGTEIPFSKSYLQGYQEGAKSVFDSLTITLNSYTIGANSQTYANNTIERGELSFDQQYSAYAFSGVIAINLLGQVERGTNINIDFELTLPTLEGEPNVSEFAKKFILYFSYVDSNNNLVNITGVKPNYKGGWVNSYSGDFALPITTSTIYCYLNYNTIGDNFAPTTAIATKSDITFKGLDLAQIINNAYNKGASDTNAKYSVGGLLYQSIYDLGKSEGIAQGNSFVNGLDVIATTFTKVFSIFNIEILPGIPLSIFILLPLLFGLIMFIVKLTKGG